MCLEDPKPCGKDVPWEGDAWQVWEVVPETLDHYQTPFQYKTRKLGVWYTSKKKHHEAYGGDKKTSAEDGIHVFLDGDAARTYYDHHRRLFPRVRPLLVHGRYRKPLYTGVFISCGDEYTSVTVRMFRGEEIVAMED